VLCLTIIAVLLSGCVMIEPVAESGTVDIVAAERTFTSEVKTHASRGDEQVVQGAKAQIVHSDGGVLISFETSELTPGNVYTAWWVFINNPADCATLPCTPKDVLGNSDVVVSDLGYADGLIADADGYGKFTSYQPLGDLPNAWIGNGYTNLGGAEIHVIINEHGPALTDTLDNMLNSYRGGCTDESIPAPFPDTARADGIPGPNPCQLFQFAIFMPQESTVEIVPSLTEEISTHASRGDVTVVDSAEAQIVHADDGLFMSFDTSDLTPGNDYTAWWVLINNPEACETIPCTPKDVLGNSDAVVSDLGYADGLIAGANGTGRFAAHQPLSELRNAWIGNGFSNLEGAEVHVIINEHGP